MREYYYIAIGVLGGVIAELFGGWDTALTTLAILMGADIVTGWIVAAVFHNSKKTESGKLESRVGWKGLCRKGATFLVIMIAYRLDLMAGTTFLKDAVIIAFTANEALSVVENVGLMGVPIPKIIMEAIDVLRKKSEEGVKNGN